MSVTAAPFEETIGESGNENTGLPTASAPHINMATQEEIQPDRPYQVCFADRAPFTLTVAGMDELLKEVFAEFSFTLPKSLHEKEVSSCLE